MDRKIALLLGRNDNDAELRWCIDYDGGDDDSLGECDVRRMRDALNQHHYEVHVVEQERRLATDIHQKLKDLTQACDSSDEMLFYFSGHGIWEDGRLELVFDKNERLLADTLLHDLRRCRAAQNCSFSIAAMPLPFAKIGQGNGMICARCSPPLNGKRRCRATN